MTSTEYRVALVVDPDLGDKLVDLALNVHVWAVESPSNRAAATQYRSTEPEYSFETGITVFTGGLQQMTADDLAGTLQAIELHHGHFSHTPEVSIIDVFGSLPAGIVEPAFATIGFESVETTDFGYRALRKRTPTSACNGARASEID